MTTTDFEGCWCGHYRWEHHDSEKECLVTTCDCKRYEVYDEPSDPELEEEGPP